MGAVEEVEEDVGEEEVVGGLWLVVGGLWSVVGGLWSVISGLSEKRRAVDEGVTMDTILFLI